jgi:hypothetical protein
MNLVILSLTALCAVLAAAVNSHSVFLLLLLLGLVWLTFFGKGG